MGLLGFIWFERLVVAAALAGLAPQVLDIACAFGTGTRGDWIPISMGMTVGEVGELVDGPCPAFLGGESLLSEGWRAWCWAEGWRAGTGACPYGFGWWCVGYSTGLAFMVGRGPHAGLRVTLGGWFWV